MEQNDPGREPEPTDAELLFELARLVELEEIGVEEWNAAIDALIARCREYLSGARPMPDTPAPDDVARPAQFPIGWDKMPPEDVLMAEAKVSGWMREHRITDWAFGHSASRETLIRLTARIADLEAELAELQKDRDRLWQDRYDLLGVKSTDGLSSSEWMMRTATAERKVKDLERENAALGAERERYSNLYHDLLMSVGNAYPGETRHDTAKRYILTAENQNNTPCDARGKEAPDA